MAADDWSADVANSESLRDVLGAPPPPLIGYRLDFVHADERESSITLGFSSPTVSSGAAGLWQARGYNAVEFCLVCSEVSGFVVDGWTCEPLRSAALTGRGVVLEGETTRVSFEVGRIRASPPRGYRRGSE